MTPAERFASLAPRERMLVFAAAALGLFALLYALGIRPLLVSQRQAREDLEEQRAVLADIERVAARFGPQPGAGQQAAARPGEDSLVLLVDRSTRAAGLAAYLKRNEPEGNTGIRLRFEDAPFDELVTWLARLQAEHAVGVVAATADPGQEPGRVTANIQLGRPAH
ncbi:Type II secretion system protein M [Gammaproteobacteria bacterium]|nr:type II secretion system protein M [Gammaproteobacteria bacterium]CAG0944975.1 Type II secretion system protein M [Gammaproteobacteria bacterium]